MISGGRTAANHIIYIKSQNCPMGERGKNEIFPLSPIVFYCPATNYFS